MKIILTFALLFLLENASCQKNCLVIQGNLSIDNMCVLMVKDKVTKKRSKVYKVQGFLVSVNDSTNKNAIGIDGTRISSFPILGDTLDRENYIYYIWDKIPPGKYYVILESIICIKINPKYSNEGDYRLPNKTIEIRKK